MPLKDLDARKAYAKAYAMANRGRLSIYRSEYRDTNREVITAKKREAWHENSDKNKANLRARYASDPAYWREYARQQYQKNKEVGQQYTRTYRLNNYKIIKAKKKEYNANNKHIRNAAVARRKASKIQRTPAWLTEDELWLIKEIYELAQARTELFGFSWHVDHIIPLQGKLVSGLHIPENMQVIPGIDNIKKYNTYRVSDVV